MDIKVRTKTGVSLIDCTHKDIGLYNQRPNEQLKYVVAFNGNNVQVLGEYDTEKEAEQVLRGIESTLDLYYRKGNIGGIIIDLSKEKNEKSE